MRLTYADELLLEGRHVLALGHAEVVVGELVLVHAVRRVCRPNGEDGRWSLGPLVLADLFDGTHLSQTCVRDFGTSM